MNLIALILGLALERMLTSLLHLREIRNLDGYFDWGLRRIGATRGTMAYVVGALVILLAVLPVLLLSVAFGDVLLGLPWLAFAAIVLVFSLGPRDLGREVQDYLDAVDGGSQEVAGRVAKELMESDVPPEPGRRALALEEAVFVQANNRVFGVIFWFMLLGPAGAWLFRVCDLFRRRAVFEAGRSAETGPDLSLPLVVVQSLFGVLAWLPARLLALGYAMAGSFEDAVADWKRYYEDCSDKFFHVNDDVIACAGRGAIREGGGTREELAAEPVRAAMQLVTRTLLIWVTAIALLTLFGWLV